MAAFRHTHVVPLTPSANWYIVDRKIGPSLADLQRTSGPLDARHTLRVLLDALIGLDAVHKFGAEGQGNTYVHGELCPASIIAGRDGVGMLVAVPTRRLVGAALHDASGYLAPEKLLGDALDQRADIFSVGVLLWEAIAGRRLFPDGRVDAVVTQLVGGKVPALRCTADAAWAAPLDSVITRALAVDPSQRWPSVAAMIAAIDNLTYGQLAGAAQLAKLVALALEREQVGSGSTRPGVVASSSLAPIAGPTPSSGPPAPPSARPIYARHEPAPPGQIAWEHAGTSTRPLRAIAAASSQSARQAKVVALAIALSVAVAGASAYVLIFSDAPAPEPLQHGSILVSQPAVASAPVLALVPLADDPAVGPQAEKNRTAAPDGPTALNGNPPPATSASAPGLTRPPAPANPAPRPTAAPQPAPPAQAPPPARPNKPRPDPKEVFGI